jgi:hypothetical protein
MGTEVFGCDSVEGNTNIYHICIYIYYVCTRHNTRALGIFSLGFLQESRKKNVELFI